MIFIPILLCIFFFFPNGDCACSNTSSLVGFESELKMVQHQLRGSIEVIDDCTFRVSQFDMLSGSNVSWWGAAGADISNLTAGFTVSDDNALMNQTCKNETFLVRLRDNVTWDQINVLAVWDSLTASDFGHVVFPYDSGQSPAPSPSPGDENSPSPSPSPSPSSSPSFRVYNEPTMFDNCKVLSKRYRFRWTLDVDHDTIDIGLEAATGTQNYMAFGWANPDSKTEYMIGGDVAVTGFTAEAIPFADDYFITRYSECTVNKDGNAKGVCPDTIYDPEDPIGSVNNTQLLYGHRRDGVSFIRYQRTLTAAEKKYDLTVNYKENATVIWAMGLLSSPDELRPYYLPQNHGGEESVSFGHLVLNVSHKVNDCLGPIDAADKEDQDLIVADKNEPLEVVAGEALHYPNPPNPTKVLYVNKKEAPVIRVERGVPVKFSIMAGHDVALYITSDPIGGNATSRNKTETVYAGGPDAEGVLASPTELIWVPNRNTPDRVYYHSLYEPKMGWKVQVVDGGLSDMYNNSVFLDDQQVTLYWTLSEESETISFAARAEKKSRYLAIGFGSGMVHSYAYVGWVEANGAGHVSSYWIDGQDAMSVHPIEENLTYVRCGSEEGVITMEFTRPLRPSCSDLERPECKNIIDPTTPLKVIWAMGWKWNKGRLSGRNMHSAMSKRPVRVLLMRGSAEADQDLRPVLAVHGFMMFLAWGILLPSGILTARYLKHLKGDGWYRFHVYLQCSGLAIVFLGLLFAIAELRGFHIDSVHVKFGVAAIVLGIVQPVNAYFRPKKQDEVSGKKRVVWEYFHVVVGRSAIVVGMVGLVTGMKHLGYRYGGEDVRGLDWALVGWFLLGAVLVAFLEYKERKRRKEGAYRRGTWVLGDLEGDDSTDLLSPSKAADEVPSSRRVEVQLQPSTT